MGVLLAAVMLAGCAGQPSEEGSLAVGAGPDPDSAVLAHLYAAALRSGGATAHVQAISDPLAGLDTGEVTVVPGFTGQLLRRFQPDAVAITDERVYRTLLAALPEGVAAGDYTTAAEDKPALAVIDATATRWGGRDLKAAAANCAKLVPGAVTGTAVPASLGRCRLAAPRQFPDSAALFNALQSGRINAAWTTMADPEIPDDVTVLADRKPVLVQAENVVPLYRRNELAEREVLAINEIAGVLDTAALTEMRQQVADGTDPRSVTDAWLTEHPLGR